MSNLKNNFASKLTSVVKTSAKRGFVYTASFEDGTTGVIRTSGREYVSVTQISTWYDDGRTDFLFSAKVHPSLGKNEAHREIVTLRITAPAPKPVEAAVEAETANAIKADKVWQAKWEAAWPQHVAPTPVADAPKSVQINLGPISSDPQLNVNNTVITLNTHTGKYVVFAGKRFVGAYDTMLEASKVALALEPTDKELAAYQPKIVTDAITNALAEQHRLEHSGDGDCDRHPLG